MMEMDLPEDGRIEKHTWDLNQERLHSVPQQELPTSSNKKIKLMSLTGSYDHPSPSVLSTRQETQKGLRSVAATAGPVILTQRIEESGKRKHSETDNLSSGGKGPRGIEAVIQDFSLAMFQKLKLDFADGSAVFAGFYRNVSILTAVDYCSPDLAQRIISTVSQLQSPTCQSNYEYDYAILNLLAKLGCKSGAALCKSTDCMDPIYVPRTSDKLKLNDYFIRADAVEEQLPSDPFDQMKHRPYVKLVSCIVDGYRNVIVEGGHGHEGGRGGGGGDNSNRDPKDNHNGSHPPGSHPDGGPDSSSGGSSPDNSANDAIHVELIAEQGTVFSTFVSPVAHSIDLAVLNTASNTNDEVADGCQPSPSAEDQALSISPPSLGGSFREVNVITKVSFDGYGANGEVISSAVPSNNVVEAQRETEQGRFAIAACKEDQNQILTRAAPDAAARRTSSPLPHEPASRDPDAREALMLSNTAVSPRPYSGFGIMRSSRNISSGRLSRDVSSSVLQSIPEGKHEEDGSSESSSVARSLYQSSMEEDDAPATSNTVDDDYDDDMSNVHNFQLHIVDSSVNPSLMEKLQNARKEVEGSSGNKFQLTNIVPSDDEIRKSFASLALNEKSNKFTQREEQFAQAVRRVLCNPTIMMTMDPLNTPPIQHMVYGFPHAHLEEVIPVAAHVHDEGIETEEGGPEHHRLSNLLRKLYFMLDRSDAVSPKNVIGLKKAVINVEEDLRLGRSDTAGALLPRKADSSTDAPTRSTAASAPTSASVRVPANSSAASNNERILKKEVNHVPHANDEKACKISDAFAVTGASITATSGCAMTAGNSAVLSLVAIHSLSQEEVISQTAIIESSDKAISVNCPKLNPISSKMNEIFVTKLYDLHHNCKSDGAIDSMKYFCPPFEEDKAEKEKPKKVEPNLKEFDCCIC